MSNTTIRFANMTGFPMCSDYIAAIQNGDYQEIAMVPDRTKRMDADDFDDFCSNLGDEYSWLHGVKVVKVVCEDCKPLYVESDGKGRVVKVGTEYVN